MPRRVLLLRINGAFTRALNESSIITCSIRFNVPRRGMRRISERRFWHA